MHLMRYALFAASRAPLNALAFPGPAHRALREGIMMRVGTFHINTSAERTMIRSKENRRVELRKTDGIMDGRENNMCPTCVLVSCCKSDKSYSHVGPFESE